MSYPVEVMNLLAAWQKLRAAQKAYHVEHVYYVPDQRREIDDLVASIDAQVERMLTPPEPRDFTQQPD